MAQFFRKVTENLLSQDGSLGSGEQRFRDRAWVSLLGVAPLRAYSRLVRAAAGLPVPERLRPLLWSSLAERLGMDLTEAELEPAEYPTFASLFTRRLRAGARPGLGPQSAVVSPVDGCVSAVGLADGERLLQAKGMDFSIRVLVGADSLA